jgi:hypothetical protein
MTSILSFDVGLRHLAICRIDGVSLGTQEFGKVSNWEVLDLGQVSTVEQCCLRLLQELDQRFHAQDFACDWVVIERQPRAKSVIMVALQMFLCGYFTLMKTRGHIKYGVKFSSACRKLNMQLLKFVDRPDFAVKGTPRKERDRLNRARYAANKKYAINASLIYLEHMKDTGAIEILNKTKKKDDLCDAFLQALAFVENDGKCTRPMQARKQTNF